MFKSFVLVLLCVLYSLIVPPIMSVFTASVEAVTECSVSSDSVDLLQNRCSISVTKTIRSAGRQRNCLKPPQCFNSWTLRDAVVIQMLLHSSQSPSLSALPSCQRATALCTSFKNKNLFCSGSETSRKISIGWQTGWCGWSRGASPRTKRPEETNRTWVDTRWWWRHWRKFLSIS